MSIIIYLLSGKSRCKKSIISKKKHCINNLKTAHPHIAIKSGRIENYMLGIGDPENYKSDSTKRVYWKFFIFK